MKGSSEASGLHTIIATDPTNLISTLQLPMGDHTKSAGKTPDISLEESNSKAVSPDMTMSVRRVPSRPKVPWRLSTRIVTVYKIKWTVQKCNQIFNVSRVDRIFPALI